MKKLAIIALMVWSVFVTAAEVTIEDSTSLAAGGEVVVKGINGSILIHGWDKDEVQLKAVKKARKEADLSKLEVSFEKSGNTVEITVKKTSSGMSWGDSGSVTMEIWVPHEVTLHARTTNGKLKVSEITGDVTLASTNGKIEALALNGSLNARSTNGGVTGELLSHNGNDMSLKTTNGGLKLRVPASLAADISANTSNGSISCDLSMVVSNKKRNSLKATTNGGGAKVELRSTNGGIHISRN